MRSLFVAHKKGVDPGKLAEQGAVSAALVALMLPRPGISDSPQLPGDDARARYLFDDGIESRGPCRPWFAPHLLHSALRRAIVTRAMANSTPIDVAEHAGVSIRTVSRVINIVKSVKPRIRERVMRAIEELDYHPNPSARGLGGERLSPPQ